jgi:hypothetical protein
MFEEILPSVEEKGAGNFCVTSDTKWRRWSEILYSRADMNPEYGRIAPAKRQKQSIETPRRLNFTRFEPNGKG